MDQENRKRIEQRAEEILNEDPDERYERLRRRGAELIAEHELRREQKARRRTPAPRPSQRDAAARRALAERIAFHELQQERKPTWKDELDAETRQRVEERADEILGESEKR